MAKLNSAVIRRRRRMAKTNREIDRILDSAGPEEFYAAMNNATNGTYVESRFEDAIINQFIMNRMSQKLDTFVDETLILQQIDIHKKLYKELSNLFPVRASQINTYASVYAHQEILVLTYNSSNSLKVVMHGNEYWIDRVKNMLNDKFEVVSISIDWVTTNQMNTISVPIIAPQGIRDSSYPFIEGGVDNFVNDFINGNENILLLIGEPGTGKSNLIKHIVSQSEKPGILTYDPEIMKMDSFFSQFVDGEYGSLIMEDADAFLSARIEGNHYMSKFLNVGDGLVSMKNKKIIFSTNLENLDSVDPALVRPGRCFSVVHFRKLNNSETKTFLKDHEIDGWTPEDGESYTLAEIYNATGRTRQLKKRKVGFLG